MRVKRAACLWAHCRIVVDALGTSPLHLARRCLASASAYTDSDGGQLRSRFDAQAAGGALRESFHYDGLNRLTLWCVGDPDLYSNDCAQSRFGVRYGFTDNGNLDERRTFANGGVNTPLESISFAYPAAGSARPHAVTSRSWSTGQGSAGQFRYDEGGRQWQRPGQVLTYNHNDLPERIVGANGTTQYLYAADGVRFEKRSILGPNLTRTTTYAGGLYEMRQETGTAATEPKTHVFYKSLGNTMLAQLVRKEPDPTALEVEYFHNDHLGTVSFTTNSAAIESTIVRSDPYGNRFDPTRAPRLDQPPRPAIAGVTRGFTGHEMEVDDLGVINMRGRIFDPINGRFNSPDPIVHSAHFGQSYNRYLYVLGNPTGYTDPTGYDAYADNERAYNLRRLGADTNGASSSSSGLDDQLEQELDALNDMMRESMDEAQEAEEKREQTKPALVESIKSTGVSEGAAKAIVNAHAQRVAQGSAARDFMVSGTQKQQTAMPSGARSATTNSGLLADNGASNGQTATDAPRYGQKDGQKAQVGGLQAAPVGIYAAFRTVEEAGRTAAGIALHRTLQDGDRTAIGNRPEYGAAIFQHSGSDSYLIGQIVRGTAMGDGNQAEVSARAMARGTDRDATIVAFAHSHPNDSRFDSGFSPRDRENAAALWNATTGAGRTVRDPTVNRAFRMQAEFVRVPIFSGPLGQTFIWRGPGHVSPL